MKKTGKILLMAAAVSCCYLLFQEINTNQSGNSITQNQKIKTNKKSNLNNQNNLLSSNSSFENELQHQLNPDRIGDIQFVWSSYTGEGITMAIISDGFSDVNELFTRPDGTNAFLNSSCKFYLQNGSAKYELANSNWSNLCGDDQSGAGSVIAAVAASPFNDNHIVGVAPEANILGLSVPYDDSACLNAAIGYAVDCGVDVICIDNYYFYSESFTVDGANYSGNSKYETSFNNACERAYENNILVLSSSFGSGTNYKSYPACSSHVVSIGKCNSNKFGLTNTDYNPSTNSGEKIVDILCFGDCYLSYYVDGKLSSDTNEYYGHGVVFGAAALWKQSNPDGSPDDFLNQLQQSADDAGKYKDLNVKIDYDGYSDPVYRGPSNIECGTINIKNLISLSDSPEDSFVDGELKFGSDYNSIYPRTRYLNDSLGNKWSVSIYSSTARCINWSDYSKIQYVTKVEFKLQLNEPQLFSHIGLTIPAAGSPATLYDADVIAKIDSTTVITSNTKSTYSSSEQLCYGTTLTITYTNITRDINLGSFDYAYKSSVENVNHITLSKYAVSVDVNGFNTETLVATPHGSIIESYGVSWSSSDENVATVSQDGLVTGIYPGKTYVTASSLADSSYKVSCEVTVKKDGYESYHEELVYDENNVENCWNITDYSVGSFILCPINDANYSVASFGKVFAGVHLLSDVRIKISSATYGNGNNPTSSTYEIFSDYECTQSIPCTRSGELPTSKKYTRYYLTISKENALSLTNGIYLKITKPGRQIRLDYVSFEFDCVNDPDRILESLQVSYSGGIIYHNSAFNTNTISVLGVFSKPDLYPSKIIKPSEYEISNFTTSVVGVQNLTVTYCGIQFPVTPLKQGTIALEVVPDPITKVYIRTNKTYYVGDRLSGSDFVVTVTRQSGKQYETTDFSLVDEGSLITYADIPGGGEVIKKDLTFIIEGSSYNYTVDLSRQAYVPLAGIEKKLTKTEFASSDIPKSSGSACSTVVNIGGIEFNVSPNIYLANQSYLSFGKDPGFIKTLNPFTTDISSVNILESYRTDGILKISKDATNWILYDESELAKGGYRYFSFEYETASYNLNSTISKISITLTGNDNPKNIANYIMYEDTVNQCTSKFEIAINKLNTMIQSDKELFWTSEDYVIATARERLIAWAKHENVDLVFDGVSYVANSAKGIGLFDESNNIFVIIAIASIVSISGVGIYLTTRRKYQ